ncbi:MAG: hypothetical protein ACRDRK_12645, partial [Pseudonocardia sp.]
GADIAAVETKIEELVAPFARAVEKIDEVPGIGLTAAHVILAEAGSRGALLRPRPPQNRACASSTHTAQASREGVAGAGFLRLRV